jgi:hypothetical protein
MIAEFCVWDKSGEGDTILELEIGDCTLDARQIVAFAN